jgi:hypothetical protein
MADDKVYRIVHTEQGWVDNKRYKHLGWAKAALPYRGGPGCHIQVGIVTWQDVELEDEN